MKFESIYKQYWQPIFRLCMGYINDSARAQDLTQETFIIVWKSLPKFRQEASLSTWIFRIAVNLCLRQLKIEKRIPQGQLPEQVKDEDTVNREPQVAFLYQCIAELPETDRIIISLELENVKQAEIAVITGLSEGNVRIRIHRIKERLSKKFKGYEH
ncbi:RNA polymerase subunit sigma-24 [Niabella ginsenosidivorans]|uniref:RNA polymerase sigma factor n=1 Tax=Niabella ginsenosidivorans TaxID=1176587 RepID=A0A1A9I500_9BACT|nr:RNA polymerase sigma factor [Niabella ginsenosidivorans]ANH81762.1 RNA polymerase subunit sigma-24 [Niabella ginsenosidivorans]